MAKDEGAVVLPKNPALRALAERTAAMFELAADKVAANASAPAAFPLPAEGGSIEQLLARRFKTLPAGSRTAAAKAAAPRLAKPALDGVVPGKPTPIEKQVAALPRRGVPRTTLAALKAEAAKTAEAAPAAAKVTPVDKLEVRIHAVKCLDETSELFSDEIDLGGLSCDESASVLAVKPFRVGSFDTGKTRTYDPPRRFTWFNILEEGENWPKTYGVTFALAEIDSGGFNDFVRDAAEKVRAEVEKAAGDYVETQGGPAAGKTLREYLEPVIRWVMGKLFDWLSNVWKDDLFPPYTPPTRTILSRTYRWAGSTTNGPWNAVIRGHGGSYRLTYDWRLFAGPA